MSIASSSSSPRAGVHATFFTLGWIAERIQPMVRRIVAAGHELASHGYDHTRADTPGSGRLRAPTSRRTRRLLEDIGGVAVHGYRAATFSIGARNPWAFRVLEDAGYPTAPASIRSRTIFTACPMRRAFRSAPTAAALWELPMTTVRAFGRNWPCSGGGYFRLLPYTRVSPRPQRR